MIIDNLAVAQSQEVRVSNTVIANGATVTVGALANNRVLARFAPTVFAGAVGNVFLFIQYVADSVPVGIGCISQGQTFVEVDLERHSHMVKGPFLINNLSGFAVTIGLVELLQNINPDSVL